MQALLGTGDDVVEQGLRVPAQSDFRRGHRLGGLVYCPVVQRIVQSLLVAAGADSLSEKWGVAASLGKQKLSGVLGLVVYFIILVPVLISALSALQLEAITQPASDMLGKILGALPNIVGASLILLIAMLVGKVVSGIITNLLAGVGFNNVLVKLGLTATPAQGRQRLRPSSGCWCFPPFCCSPPSQRRSCLNSRRWAR